ncbi:MAG: hypothetical protein FWE33_03060 [Defluviitaleaceae bacterium]|nr:hypothetical protein [Defluviitaleaceae bacterium]
MYTNDNEKSNNTNTLSIAQKIKLLRNANGIYQDEMADITLTSQAKISRIENGEEYYNDDEIRLIKEHFNIVGMPLTEFERNAFRESLYHWRDLLRSGRLDEAKIKQDKLSSVVNLEPCDPDLALLYCLFEVIHLLINKQLDVAEENLAVIYDRLNDENIEHLYYYYCNKGSLCAMQHKYEDALKSYTKALELRENHKINSLEIEGWLYYNLAICHSKLELPIRALAFINKIPKTYIDSRITIYGLGINIEFAINCTAIGEYRSAERVLNDCLIRAKGINNSLFEGLSLHNLGILYVREENWDKAIECLDQAFGIFKDNPVYRPWVLYYKIRCLIGKREFLVAEKAIKKAKAIYNENDVSFILFETLIHILKISKRFSVYNKASVEYIQTTSVKYLIDNFDSIEAVNCCKLLVRHCTRTNKMLKTLEAKAIISDIYEKMFINRMDGDIL